MGMKSIVRGSAKAAGVAFVLAGTVLTGLTTVSAAEKGKEDPSKRVCRSVTPTGSRMTTRVCRTQAEWDKSRDKTADGVLQHQLKNSTQYER